MRFFRKRCHPRKRKTGAVFHQIATSAAIVISFNRLSSFVEFGKFLHPLLTFVKPIRYGGTIRLEPEDLVPW